MNGQWIGFETKTNNMIILNIDDRGSYYEGAAYVYESDCRIPSTVTTFKTPDKNNKFIIIPTPNERFFIHPDTCLLEPWGNVAHLYPNIQIPHQFDFEVSINKNNLDITWKSSISAQGIIKSEKPDSEKKSDICTEILTWEDYKSKVLPLYNKQYIFRGQNVPKKLRTLFHRKNRTDIYRFIREDIQVLHRHLSSQTKHLFDLSIPDQYGAFLNLAQHHGYPTPLLDWTYSPFVAAFFAFRNLPENNENDVVRIYYFDQMLWKKHCPSVPIFSPSYPHFSVWGFSAIENKRMIPQQGVSTITNMDDIEFYIRSNEKRNNTTYLYAFELKISERKEVMRELTSMNITAGSLFPGLDGACEELKERNF